MNDAMSFEHFTLPSGLRVFHQHRNVPWFSTCVMVDVGHLDDPPGKEGLAHLLEHQLNSGTSGMPWTNFTEFEQWADTHEFDVYHGATSEYHTCYGGRAWTEDAEKFYGFFEAYLRRPRLDGMLDHDRRIIRAERIDRATGQRSRSFNEAVDKAAFGEHRHTTCTGLPEDDVLFALTQEDVRLAHERYYDCPNMTMIVVGGIGSRELRTILERSFVPGRAGFRPRQPFSPISFGPPTPHEIFSRKGDGAATTVQLGYEWYMRPGGEETVLLRNCLAQVLNDRVREREKLAYGVGVNVRRVVDYEKFWINTEVAPDKVSGARSAIEAALDDTAAILAHLPRKRKMIASAIAREDMNVAKVITSARDCILLEGRPVPLQERAARFMATGDEKVLACLERINSTRALVTLYER